MIYPAPAGGRGRVVTTGWGDEERIKLEVPILKMLAGGGGEFAGNFFDPTGLENELLNYFQVCEATDSLGGIRVTAAAEVGGTRLSDLFDQLATHEARLLLPSDPWVLAQPKKKKQVMRLRGTRDWGGRSP